MYIYTSVAYGRKLKLAQYNVHCYSTFNGVNDKPWNIEVIVLTLTSSPVP